MDRILALYRDAGAIRCYAPTSVKFGEWCNPSTECFAPLAKSKKWGPNESGTAETGHLRELASLCAPQSAVEM